jgi:hypothetical protein
VILVFIISLKGLVMKLFLLIFLLANISYSQNISTSKLEKITNLLLTNSVEILDFINPEELQTSNRFGIEYEGVIHKFFIANDFTSELTKKLLTYKTKHDYQLIKLDNKYSLLNIKIPSLNISKEYYLKDSLIVSSTYYHSRNWKTITSDHFKFFISDETLFNKYSINQLEKFIDRMLNILSFSETDKILIKQKKIYYFLCKDEEEIKKVTGFATRGIFMLAQDYVVTTYNTHYHELLHFLINYKLKNLPLYTHPFFQEGLAVAFGGRGGLDANTISEMGIFLVKSGFANYKELLSKLDYQSSDASISYSISGLYTNFLIKQIGIEKYLALYKKYSGDSKKVLTEKIIETDLPLEQNWNLFVDSLSNQNPVKIKDNLDVANFNSITKQKDFEIYENTGEYIFRIKDTLLINSNERIEKYQSKLFKEHFPNRHYNSEKYLIIANQNEISIYNLYSNNLIGKYVASFSIPPKAINTRDEFYEFSVEKDLFEEKRLSESFTF